MTEKEKAKAYDEAIRKLRGMMPNWERLSYNGKPFLQDLIYIFPELAESEGEKVRKELIKHLKEGAEGYEPSGGSSDYQRWLAWVEKQGEKKPEENKGNLGGISPNSAWSEEDGMILSCIVNNLKFIRDTLSRDAKYVVDVGSFEGQIEWLQSLQNRVQPQQKPMCKFGDTELTEEEVCEGLIRGMVNEHSRVTKEILRNEYEKGRADAIAEMQKEWSEEDDSRYSSCLYMLEREPSLYNWLKSLKDRVVCEANRTTTKEWSEEDEQHIDSLLKRLDSLCKNKFERTRFAISEDRDWLKSLRPQNTYNPYKAVVESIAEMCKHYDKASHSGLRDFYDNVKVKCKDAQEYDKMFPQAQWKPSDEQIGLLQAIINEPNNASSESCQIVLKDILEQLKKLRG